MFAHHLSTNDRTTTTTFRTPAEAHIGSSLSPMLAMLEGVVLCISIPYTFHGRLLRDLVHWRKFFEELRNVKVLRLHHGLEWEVADMLRHPTVNPSPAQDEVDLDATTPPGHTINSSRSMFALDMFPLLRKIKVYARTSDPIGESELVSVLGAV